LLDAAGRRRSPATTPGSDSGRAAAATCISRLRPAQPSSRLVP
jgi:hypothetical protein